MTREQIDRTIDDLSGSQGFYGRLKASLAEATEEVRNEFYSRFSTCSDPVSFVIALEG